MVMSVGSEARWSAIKSQLYYLVVVQFWQVS